LQTVSDNLVSSEYVPKIQCGAEVRLIKKDHRNSGRRATVITALNNPSKRGEHQWYDVRFDNGTLGRFRESELEFAMPKHLVI
jgi:hypothetical protein